MPDAQCTFPLSCLMLQAKEMMEQRKAARAARGAQLDAQIAEQRAAITKMETELEASGQVCKLRLYTSVTVHFRNSMSNNSDTRKPRCE